MGNGISVSVIIKAIAFHRSIFTFLKHTVYYVAIKVPETQSDYFFTNLFPSRYVF